MSVVSSASFAMAFHDKDDQGVEILMNKLRQAKQTLSQMQNLFAQRASIEEDYGKKLLKLSKASLGKDETGTVHDALNTVRNELEFAGRSHLELAALIRSELEQATIEFLAVQKEQRKSHTSVIERSMRSKALHTASMQKAKERYEAEYMKANGMAPPRTGGMMSKLNMIGQGNNTGRNSELEYQEACTKLQTITQRFENDWRQACDKFQIMEEERIEFIRNTFWNYANIFAGVCVTDDESFERVRQSLEHCDIDRDIATFIDLKGINTMPLGDISNTTYSSNSHLPQTQHSTPTMNNGQEHGQMTRPEEHNYHQDVHATPAHPVYSPTTATIPQQQQQQVQQVQQQQTPSAMVPNGPAGIAATTGYSPQGVYPPNNNSNNNLVATAGSSPVQQTHPGSGQPATNISNTPLAMNDSPSSATAPTSNTSGSGGFLVKAIYDYDATMEEEMSFKEGEIIRVLATQLDGWWEGEIENGNGARRRGQFPSNFIEPLGF